MFKALFWAITGTHFGYLPYKPKNQYSAFSFPRAYSQRAYISDINDDNIDQPAQ